MFWCSSSASAFLPCPRQCSSSSCPVQRRTKGEGNDGRSWWRYPESNRGKHTRCNHLPLFFTLLKIATLLVFLTFSFMTSWSGFGTRSPPGTVNVQCSGSSWWGLLANIASLWNGNDRVLAVSTVQTKQGKMPSSSEALFLGQYWWNKAVKTSLPSSQLKWGQETRFTLVLHTHTMSTWVTYTPCPPQPQLTPFQDSSPMLPATRTTGWEVSRDRREGITYFTSDHTLLTNRIFGVYIAVTITIDWHCKNEGETK